MAIARAVSGLGGHDGTGDKEIGRKRRRERRGETERRLAARRAKAGKKLAERRKELARVRSRGKRGYLNTTIPRE